MNKSATHFRTFYQAHGKAPAEKYKGVPHLHTLDEARQFYEYGGVVADGRVTVDIDEPSQFQAALAECDSLKLNYSARLTSRGGHLDFADPLGMVKKGSTHALCAGGLTVDYRIPGQCIALKIGGVERKYIRAADMNQPVSPIPPFLRPCNAAKDLSGVAPGDGRNSALYGYCATLMRSGFTTEETRSVIRFINARRFAVPLTEDELRVILRDEAFANLTKPNVVTAFNDCPVELLDSLSKLRPEVNPMYPATDIGCGRLFADVFKPVARYVPERKMWFTYNGSRWITDVGSLAAMELCKMLADALAQYVASIDANMVKKAFSESITKWQVRRNRETYLRDAASVYPVSMREFDKNPYVFNCQNGTLNLSSGAFAPHTPDDLLTKMSGVRFDPNARCQRWETFIDEVMSGDAAKAQFLQKALGYALTGDTSLECMFILFGPTTRNGKGTCMETYLEMMGDYGVSTRPETIGARTGNNGSTPTEDIARLAGARFANVSEPDRKLVLNASLVKSMVGNDTLNARNLYENSFDFKPQFKLFVNCNHLPTVTDMTVFSSGRIKIIPFDRHFEEHEQDLSLKAFLRRPENLSGVFNWCVEGYRMMRETGLDMPQSVKDATVQYAHVSDKTKLFIEDALDIDAKYETPTAEVYAKYRDWCQENGYMPESARNLNAALQEDARLKVERKRPERGGDKTTVLLGARLNGDISLF